MIWKQLFREERLLFLSRRTYAESSFHAKGPCHAQGAYQPMVRKQLACAPETSCSTNWEKLFQRHKQACGGKYWMILG